MSSQDISDKPYEKCIRLFCRTDMADDKRKAEADKFRDEIIEALDIIWEHPEGRKKIEMRPDNKMLTISYGDTGDMHALNANMIRINYGDLENGFITTKDKDGNSFTPSMLDVVAHELLHTTQANNGAEAYDYQKRFELANIRRNSKSEEETAKVFSNFIPESYAVLSDEEKIAYLNTLYEEKTCPQLISKLTKQSSNDLLDSVKEDNKMAAYIQKVETPAINFANEIIAFANEHYGKNYPQRMNDYLDHITTYADDYLLLKEDFISQAKSYMDTIIHYGGIDATLNALNDHYKPIVDELTPGALARIEDTPQAQIEKIELMGKGIAQNSPTHAVGRC